MWNDSKSLVLSKICVVIFFVLLVVCAILAPRLVARLMLMSLQANAVGSAIFLTTIYVGFVPAATLLLLIYIFLHRISIGRVFVKENIACLRYISWCCFAGALICIASGLYYVPWYAIGVAGAFMGIVVRAVKDVFTKAVSLQDDAELTI
ncbi:MAG: DUF2975 domain-containing protein [Oscillospiraceae bacterium]|nr:DUF2975 domain-containing protein [Oscillospiraceae bacterium]